MAGLERIFGLLDEQPEVDEGYVTLINAVEHPDGTLTEMPFETKRGKIILTLDFVNSELPVMLFRLVPQTAAL